MSYLFLEDPPPPSPTYTLGSCRGAVSPRGMKEKGKVSEPRGVQVLLGGRPSHSPGPGREGRGFSRGETVHTGNKLLKGAGIIDNQSMV